MKPPTSEYVWIRLRAAPTSITLCSTSILNRCTTCTSHHMLAEKNFTSAFALVERGPAQTIIMREPSRQWE